MNEQLLQAANSSVSAGEIGISEPELSPATLFSSSNDVPAPDAPAPAETKSDSEDSDDNKASQRKESSDSDAESNTITTRVALLKKTGVAKSSVVLVQKIVNCSLLIGVCLPANYRDFKVDEFVTNILRPILQSNRPFQLTTVYLFIGSITTDRSAETLCVETDRDRECADYFQQAITRVDLKVKRRKIEINVLPWSDLARKPGFRDLYQYVRQECSNGLAQAALMEDARSYLGRRYFEGSEADIFIQWYIKEACKNGFENERAVGNIAANSQFRSVRGITIESSVVSHILQWQKEGVYEHDVDQSYLDEPVQEKEEIDLSPEKMTRIVEAYYTAYPHLSQESIGHIEEVALTFILTLRYLMRETAGFLVLGEMAMFSTVFCRDQKNRPWLKAMEIIWKKNQGPFLKTEQIEAKIKELEVKKNGYHGLVATGAKQASQNNNSPPASSSPPLKEVEAKEVDASSPPVSSAPSPNTLPDGAPNSPSVAYEVKAQDGQANFVYGQNAMVTQRLAITTSMIALLSQELVAYGNKTDPCAVEMRLWLFDIIRETASSVFKHPTTSFVGRGNISGDPPSQSQSALVKGLMMHGVLSPNRPNQPPTPAAEKTLPTAQRSSGTLTATSPTSPVPANITHC